jgi:hypothetical protein
MNGRLALFLALQFAISPVLAEEVLYCVDTQAIGFKCNQSGQTSSATFNLERYTPDLVIRNLLYQIDDAPPEPGLLNAH